jgi:hypothetical protein
MRNVRFRSSHKRRDRLPQKFQGLLRKNKGSIRKAAPTNVNSDRHARSE